MYEAGQGVPKDQAAALGWFKRGAELNNPHAVKAMVEVWEGKVGQANNIAGVREAMTELVKLGGKDYVPHRALARIKTMQLLEANARVLPSLAGKSINPTFCPLTRHEEGTQWWISVLAIPGTFEDESTKLAEGTVDSKGCVTLPPACLDSLRKIVALGKTPVLRWPGQGRLMSLATGPGGKLMFVAEPRQYDE